MLKKGISGRKQKNHPCVRPWLLLIVLIFFAQGPADTTVYVCSPSSHRDNNPIHKSNYTIELREVSYVPKRDLEERESFKGSWSLLTFC